MPLTPCFTSREAQPDFVFFNQVAIAALAPKLRPLLPAPCRFVALSHGLESTDLLHYIRLRNLSTQWSIRPEASYALGSAILTENRIAIISTPCVHCPH